MRRHLVLKAIGTTVIIGIFFVVYLHLLHHPRLPVTVMPATELDRLAAVPARSALFLYLSLWLYVGAGPGLQLRLRELVSYAAWSVMLCAAGLAIFHFWPTQVPASGLDLSRYFGFAMLQGIDAAGNACPSMHVAFASFTAVRIDQVLRAIGSPRLLRAANLAWASAIVYVDAAPSSSTSSSTSAQGWCSERCSRWRRCAGDSRCRSCTRPAVAGPAINARTERCLTARMTMHPILLRSLGGSMLGLLLLMQGCASLPSVAGRPASATSSRRATAGSVERSSP